MIKNILRATKKFLHDNYFNMNLHKNSNSYITAQTNLKLVLSSNLNYRKN